MNEPYYIGIVLPNARASGMTQSEIMKFARSSPEDRLMTSRDCLSAFLVHAMMTRMNFSLQDVRLHYMSFGDGTTTALAAEINRRKYNGLIFANVFLDVDNSRETLARLQEGETKTEKIRTNWRATFNGLNLDWIYLYNDKDSATESNFFLGGNFIQYITDFDKALSSDGFGTMFIRNGPVSSKPQSGNNGRGGTGALARRMENTH